MLLPDQHLDIVLKLLPINLFINGAAAKSVKRLTTDLMLKRISIDKN